MMVIKVLIHLATILAYGIIAIKTYGKIVCLDIRRLDKCDFDKLKIRDQVTKLLRNRYFLGNTLICLSATSAFFLLIADLFYVGHIRNLNKWNFTHISLLAGIYLIRGFKLDLKWVDTLRNNIYLKFIKLFKL